MKTYFVSYVKEDKRGFGFGYRFVDTSNILNEKEIKAIADDLKKYEESEKIIIINIIEVGSSEKTMTEAIDELQDKDIMMFKEKYKVLFEHYRRGLCTLDHVFSSIRALEKFVD